MDKLVVLSQNQFVSDARIKRMLLGIRARAPRSVIGAETIQKHARKLNDWRNDEHLPAVTSARLAFRLRSIASIGRDIIAGWVTEPHGPELRGKERRQSALRKLRTAHSQINRVATLLGDEDVRAYAGPNVADLKQVIGRVEQALEKVKGERGGKELTNALRLPVGALREIGEELCGRSMRNVDRIEGEEMGPLFQFSLDIMHRLVPEISEAELSSSIRTIMREPKP